MANNKRRKSKKKSKGSLIFVAVLVVIAVVLTLFASNMLSSNVGVGSPEDSISVDIPEGSNVDDISKILAENNVVDSAAHFKFLCKTKNQGSEFRFGSYVFRGNMTFDEIVEMLNSGESEDKSIHITVKEGMWLSEIAKAVEEGGLCSADEFIKEANSREYDFDFVKAIPDRDNLLEGYLYPETYYIMPGTTAHDIVNIMLNQFDKVCSSEGIYDKAEKSGKTIDELVITGSLIESEVKVEDERPLVASVINNRIVQDMKLQIDASVIYSLGERVSRVYYKDLEKADNHNTYYVKGLPEGPICSPRAASIIAAAEPANTDYLYYVVEDKTTGKHYFTADYDDFLKASEKYKSTLE